MNSLRKALLCASVCVLFLFVFAAYAFAEGSQVGIVIGDEINVRKSPSTSSQVLDQLPKGAQVSILSSSDGWYKVSRDGIVGWASSEFVSIKQVSSKSGKITSEDVNLRSEPTTDAEVLTTLSSGTKVSVYSRSENWYKVKTAGGTTGWIHKDFISVQENATTTSRSLDNLVEKAKKTTEASTPKTETKEKKDTSNVSALSEKVSTYAKKFLGVRYVYGGSSPKGFDCSGYVQYVYDHFGVDLERVAASQAGQGTKVSRANLKAGDLIFFDTNGGHNYINHVGIYIGGGKFIHASSGRSAHKVTISELDDGFYANAYMTARRFVK